MLTSQKLRGCSTKNHMQSHEQLGGFLHNRRGENMKKKEKDKVEMKKRKSKNLHWTCCKRSEGMCALWRIAIVASVESVL